MFSIQQQFTNDELTDLIGPHYARVRHRPRHAHVGDMITYVSFEPGVQHSERPGLRICAAQLGMKTHGRWAWRVRPVVATKLRSKGWKDAWVPAQQPDQRNAIVRLGVLIKCVQQPVGVLEVALVIG